MHAYVKASGDQVLQAMQQIGHGSDKFVAISALGQRLGTTPQALHQALMDLWRQGKITVSRFEGRHGGAPPEERRWWMESQGETLAYVALRK